MTSVAFSPVARALDRRSASSSAGRERIGERVRAVDPVRDGDVEVEVCSPVFIDPEGERAPWLTSCLRPAPNRR